MDILKSSQLVIFSHSTIFITFSYRSLAGFLFKVRGGENRKWRWIFAFDRCVVCGYQGKVRNVLWVSGHQGNAWVTLVFRKSKSTEFFCFSEILLFGIRRKLAFIYGLLLQALSLSCFDISRKIVDCKASAKRWQHANPTNRNIVGRNMLRAFDHFVATCCDMLVVVGSSLKLVKFEPTTPNMSQHIAT